LTPGFLRVKNSLIFIRLNLTASASNMDDLNIADILTNKGVAEPVELPEGQGRVRLDFEVLDADPAAYKPIVAKLTEIIVPLAPDFLVTFRHENLPAKVAAELGVGHGEAVKVWFRPPDDSAADFYYLTAKYYDARAKGENTQDFQLAVLISEKILEGKRKLVFIDLCLETGYAAITLIKKLREYGCEVNDAIFLVEILDRGGEEALLREGVRTHALTGFSVEGGFENKNTEFSVGGGGLSESPPERLGSDRRDRFPVGLPYQWHAPLRPKRHLRGGLATHLPV